MLIQKVERISVIVPVYNGKAYLKTCIDSIVGQDYPDLEVILVDDGSEDGSGSICEDYGRRFRNVRVLHKENEGQGAARRDGARAASGAYLMFVDADDWMAGGVCTALYRAAKEHGADMAFSRICRVYGDGSQCVLKGLRAGAYTGLETARGSLSSRGVDAAQNNVALWGVLMRREAILGHLEAADSRIWYGEDTVCLLEAELECARTVVVDRIGYYYRENSQSVTSLHNRSNRLSIELVYRRLYGSYKRHRVPEDMLRALDYFVVRLLLLNGRDAFDSFPGIYPYEGTEGGGRPAIYGAGKYGAELYQSLAAKKQTAAVWADRQWERLRAQGLPVDRPEDLLKREYDFLLIAVLDSGKAEEIRRELLDMGIQESRIRCMSRAVIDGAYTRGVLDGLLRGQAPGERKEDGHG